jgi:hypothetical protein
LPWALGAHKSNSFLGISPSSRAHVMLCRKGLSCTRKGFLERDDANADYQRQWLDSVQLEDPSKPDGIQYGYGITRGVTAAAFPIADQLSKAGSWGYVSAIDSNGRTIWIADTHRDNGKRFVMRADGKLTAFMELEAATRRILLLEHVLQL